ncbi:Na+-translocating ferredoxin:NAD+ oxidoreductase RNF, RnfC subunit [Dethiosulfatibacter aminovorans DSM 17477]|uniref:Na+-translocating ferredoxin:NAD+ oxidoreductase RNF, RnfC subunit n=1 Tax=Dethiosulfatibacter aminovorans DSM 17477 TaxID=1121476 RepID=A0A1M6DQQ6_9FIRM|nr:4Fe-4S dicluster domain-containing protein [Dethiosulfatibacter aminovorans]SHI75308.1 Na+-translocating ferredoxin:NAD+ oxidoreductase RNF, RnfC subunit [Dethiosulfatibacter aminovorans DSM 17477]
MKLVDKVYCAGIVGCGGAGFPTHVKMNAKVEYFLINAVECEPLLYSDRWIMKNKAHEVVVAISAVMKELEAQTCIIALKNEYKSEIESLKDAIKKNNANIRIHGMKSFYPAGDEQVVVYETTGRIVPEGGIPLNVGCVVSNVTTLKHIFDAINGIPFTNRVLTVTGNVKNPTIVDVPIGTSFEECIEIAGGSLTRNYSVIDGGPMMGKYLEESDVRNSHVKKTTSGIIVLSEDDHLTIKNRVSIETMRKLASSACIQCNFCSQLCPRNLLGHGIQPHRIMRKLAMNTSFESILQYDDVKAAMLCSECGVCENFACPMGLQPRTINSEVKKLLAENGIRYGSEVKELKEDYFRRYRKIPTKRIISRLGLNKYYLAKIEASTSYKPNSVSIPLSQHIGAPSKPVVEIGDSVTEGQVIASCEEGKLGARVHASISGMVREITDKIVISK